LARNLAEQLRQALPGLEEQQEKASSGGASPENSPPYNRPRYIENMERQSIGAFLDDFLRHSSEPAYVQRRGYRVERWTYGEVARLAFQFARELDALGMAKGDRVLLWGENCAEWVATFFACALRGVIAVPMDDTASSDFAARVLAETDARLAVCSHQHRGQVSGAPSLGLEELRDRVQGISAEPCPPAPVDPSDPLEIIFTSGTTAAPKGVVISHANVLSNLAPLEAEIRNYLKYERWVHPVRFLNLLPLSHVFGQFLGLFLPPLMAGTVALQSALGPTEVIETIRRERISVLVAVPRTLQSLKEKVERDLEADCKLERFRARFTSAKQQHFLRRWWTFRRIRRQFGWKFWAFISGGAALDSDTEEFWGRLGYAVIQGYGLTETTSLISVNHPFRIGKGSIGKVLPGREIKLAEDGEILVRGGSVAFGYWQNHHLARVAVEEGWYHTGDVGALDEQGNLYFKGRKKNVLVTPAGMNVYPEDLEAALRTQPEVRDCVVIGLESGGNAEPCAVLILRDGNSADSVVKRTNESLAEYQRMRHWFVWPESDFPRTSTGKPKISVIADIVRAQRDARPATLDGASPLAELVSKISGRAVTGLRPEADLENDLQLSSLERVELMSALEDRYQVDLKEASYSAAHTVGELEKMLAARGAGRAQYHYPRWTLSTPVRWLRTSAYYLLVLPAIRLLGWPRIEGREHLDGVDGPLLVISNHIDDIDVGFVQTALPPHFRHFLATATGGEALEALRTPPPNRGCLPSLYDRLQWTLGVALLNLFPLPREAAFLKSFSYAGECIDRGYSVLVFPEGHHTTDGKLRTFRAGIGLLATRLNVPVLPMRIDGLFEVKQAGKRFAPPGKIRVRIGVPIRFESTADPQWIARELQSRVAEL
jgi:long-chain acyl-CoA synthetase